MLKLGNNIYRDAFDAGFMKDSTFESNFRFGFKISDELETRFIEIISTLSKNILCYIDEYKNQLFVGFSKKVRETFDEEDVKILLQEIKGYLDSLVFHKVDKKKVDGIVGDILDDFCERPGFDTVWADKSSEERETIRVDLKAIVTKNLE